MIPTNGEFFSKPAATRHSNAFRAQPLHVANKNIPGPFSLLGAPLCMSEFTVLTFHTLQKFRQGENFATFLDGKIFPAKFSPPEIPPPLYTNGPFTLFHHLTPQCKMAQNPEVCRNSQFCPKQSQNSEKQLDCFAWDNKACHNAKCVNSCATWQQTTHWAIPQGT